MAACYHQITLPFSVTVHGPCAGQRRSPRRVDPHEVAITVITRIEILQDDIAAVLKANDGERLCRAQELLRQ